MSTLLLIQNLKTPNCEAKHQIEELLKKAYIGIQMLKQMSLDKTITLEKINEIETLFEQNRFDLDGVNLPKYLKNYAISIRSFWISNFIQLPQYSIIKPFNLFSSLIENDLTLKNNYSVKNCETYFTKNGRLLDSF